MVLDLTWTGSAITVAPTSLTFTAVNYNQAQGVTVRAVSDADNQDPAPIELTFSGSGLETTTRSVFVLDDEATLFTTVGDPAGPAPSEGSGAHTSDGKNLYQAFTTGGSGPGWVLQSVSLVVAASNSTGHVDTEVTLHGEDSGLPDLDLESGWSGLGTLTGDYLNSIGVDVAPEEDALLHTFQPSEGVEVVAGETVYIGLRPSAVPPDGSIGPTCTDRTTSRGRPGWSAASRSLEQEGSNWVRNR